MRHLPAGLLSTRIRLGLRRGLRPACSVRGRGQLNPLCLQLAPLALAIVFFYSFTKRFTSFSHLVLGFALGIAPAAAWIADARLARSRDPVADRRGHVLDGGFRHHLLLPGLRLRRTEGLFSLPRRLGIAGALLVARLLHVVMLACLLALVRRLHLGALSLAGMAAVAGAADLRAQPGESRRPVPRERRLLHHERLRQRAILSVLGRRYLLSAGC